MAIRTEMQQMISYLRTYGAAATTDTFQGVSYWTDAQLQDILDKHASHDTLQLRYLTSTSYGLPCPRHVWFDDNATLLTSEGLASAVPFTYNAAHGEVDFVTAPNTTLLITGLKVNLFEALADLWATKAQQRYNYVDFKAGNNKMDMSMELRNCERQRDYYRARTIRRFQRITTRFTT